MQSMAISLADSLGRTARGDQELAQAQHGLSVAQRKLLAQLGSPGTLEDIARGNNWDTDYTNKTATRLVELGLVESFSKQRPTNESMPAESEGESARVLPLSRPAPPLSSKRWPAAVGAVMIGAAVLIWWSLSGTSNSTVEMIAQSPKPGPASAAANKPPEGRASSTETKTTELPKAVFSMTLQQPQAPAATPPAPPAAAASPAPAASVPKTAPAPTVTTRGLGAPARESAVPKPTAELAAATPTPVPTPAAVTAPPPAAPEARTVVAAAAPSTTEAARPTATAVAEKALKIVQREAPSFPREAILANVSAGTVKVRMTVDGSGNVTKVDILDANPRRVFDREVQRTLARWKFEATGQTQTAETEVVFNRE